MPSDSDNPGYQRSKGQRENDEPGGQLHREIGGAYPLRIGAGQTGDGECQEASDRAEPTDGESDMGDEHELAETRCHIHGV